MAASQVSASIIKTSYFGLKWVHDIAGTLSSAFVRNKVEGAKRQNAKLIAKKSPISREVRTAYCTKYEHSSELPIRTDIFVALFVICKYFQLLFAVVIFCYGITVIFSFQ